jgi:hypothetical protein
MTTTDTLDLTSTQPDRRDLLLTGLAYLGLAVTGMLGFLVVRPRLYTEEAGETLTRLVENEGLARVGIALELGVVLTQVVAALWFYRLFRRVDGFTAGAIAVFGLFNAVAILGSAAAMATALDLALDPVGEGGSQLLAVLSENFWGVGNLFFGLWLIPMGLAVLRSGWAPRLLGQLLVLGGVAYLVGAFVGYLAPGAELVIVALPLIATVGELWMIGWLLLRGLRPGR